MYSFVRRNKILIAAGALVALAFRLFFVFKFTRIDGDTLIYGEIAANWLTSGIFGLTTDTGVIPTYIRLPAYPAFLTAIWKVVGLERYTPVLIVQALIDVGTCFVVADMARRTFSERAAKIAFWFTALCPFTAVYTAAPLTETLAIFFAALTLDFAIAGLDDLAAGRMRYWIGCGLAMAVSIVLRPDGGILLAALGLYLLYTLFAPTANQQEPSGGFGVKLNTVLAGVLVAAVALSPLIPWTIRNWRDFHVFQPLAPRYANGPDESANLGLQRWTKTWMVDYVSVVDFYWTVPGEKFNVNLLPSRAFDSPEQRRQTDELFSEYNRTLDWTPELDARLGQIADARVQHSRLRYYVALPVLRIADMWFRPRTDLLKTNDRWWEWKDDPNGTFWGVTTAAINVFFIGAALWAILRRRNLRWAGLLILFVLVRSAFLGSLENPETRYTLECYPVVLAFAAAAFAGNRSSHDEADSFRAAAD